MLTGLVLQVLEGGSGDAEVKALGSGFQGWPGRSARTQHAPCCSEWMPKEPLASTMKVDVTASGGMADQQNTSRQMPTNVGRANVKTKRTLQDALAGMEEQLRRHSALEDLGPLFGPKAQGRQSSGQPRPR